MGVLDWFGETNSEPRWSQSGLEVTASSFYLPYTRGQPAVTSVFAELRPALKEVLGVGVLLETSSNNNRAPTECWMKQQYSEAKLDYIEVTPQELKFDTKFDIIVINHAFGPFFDNDRSSEFVDILIALKENLKKQTSPFIVIDSCENEQVLRYALQVNNFDIAKQTAVDSDKVLFSITLPKDNSSELVQGFPKSCSDEEGMIESFKCQGFKAFDIVCAIERLKTVYDDVSYITPELILRELGLKKEALSDDRKRDKKTSFLDDEESGCKMCFDKQVDSCLLPCGHLCACYTCAVELPIRGYPCPVCRESISRIVKIYKAPFLHPNSKVLDVPEA